MAVFITDVAVRWSDMDVYGHVNNACVVTLLEEARTELLFGEGAQRGAQTLASGVVVVELLVRYRQPLVYSASPVRVQLWVSELRAASFTLDYTVAGTDGLVGRHRFLRELLRLCKFVQTVVHPT